MIKGTNKKLQMEITGKEANQLKVKGKERRKEITNVGQIHFKKFYI